MTGDLGHLISWATCTQGRWTVSTSSTCTLARRKVVHKNIVLTNLESDTKTDTLCHISWNNRYSMFLAAPHCTSDSGLDLEYDLANVCCVVPKTKLAVLGARSTLFVFFIRLIPKQKYPKLKEITINELDFDYLRWRYKNKNDSYHKKASW